jgi:hypothetical protein
MVGASGASVDCREHVLISLEILLAPTALSLT